MNDTAGKFKSYQSLGRLAQACFLISSISLLLASLVWTNQVIFFGVIPLVIAAFAWVFPAPAGVIGILFGLYQLIRYDLYATRFLGTPLPGEIVTPPDVLFIPQALYYLLYGVFTLGGTIHLFRGITALQRTPTIISNADKPMRLAARIIAIGSLLATIIVFLAVDEAAVAFHFNAWAIIALGIAWFWPAGGGSLMVSVGVYSLYDLLAQGLWPETQLLYSILFFAFTIGGILFLVLALRNRSLRTTQKSNHATLKPNQPTVN